MAHGHSHGLVDASIKRSRAGVRAVAVALVVLGVTAAAQAVVFLASGSVALLADLIHNAGDAATAIPLGIAFVMRSERAERLAGLAVVAAIFVSACVAGYEAVDRLVHPQDVEALGALALAGALGFAGNWVAAIVRTRAGRRLDSPALPPTATTRGPTRTSRSASSPRRSSSRWASASPTPSSASPSPSSSCASPGARGARSADTTTITTDDFAPASRSV